ncbi:hypothetical protein ABZW10_38335 [Kitasatospora sp. NPDC004723]|uniref:hypothetical protein n=1 Tax=Kitasatospora sp. NPDC004723 TaxID=3154288 RepID=UPI0033B0B22E
MPQRARVVNLMEFAYPASVRRLRGRVAKALQAWGVRLEDEPATAVAVVVSNTFAAALRLTIEESSPAVTVCLILVGRELTVEVRSGTGVFPDARPREAVRLPQILAVHTTDTGVERRLGGARVWATTVLPVGALQRRARHRRRRRWRPWCRVLV